MPIQVTNVLKDVSDEIRGGRTVLLRMRPIHRDSYLQRARRRPGGDRCREAAMFFSTSGASKPPNNQIDAGGTSYWDDGTGYAQVPCTRGVVTLVDPASRISVRLRSADPADHP